MAPTGAKRIQRGNMRNEDFGVVIYAPVSRRDAMIGIDWPMILKVSWVRFVWIKGA